MFREQDQEEAVLRLRRILSVFSHKLRIAICLPLLFKEENVLKILKPTEQYLFQEACSSYNFLEQSSKKEIFEEDEISLVDPKITLLLERSKSLSSWPVVGWFYLPSPGNSKFTAYAQAQLLLRRTNTVLTTVLLSICSFKLTSKTLMAYPEINSLTEEIILNLSPKSKNLIEYVSQFIVMVEQRIRTSPAEERNYRLKLRSASASLEKSETELIPLIRDLEEQRRKHHELLTEVSREIASYESIIKDTQAKHETSIKKIISNSESEMVDMYLKSREKQNALENQIEAYKIQLAKVLQEYSNREKNLRNTRLKSETKHMTAIMKYDTEIGSFQQRKEDLLEELKNLELENEKLEEELASQDITYRKMIEEKEAVLIRAFAKQIENFSKNRAAKIIQSTWRAYLARMASMKKKKKIKRK